MKNKNIKKLISFLFSITVISAVPAFADPVLIGQDVVNPYSGYNALRNPALMSFQGDDYFSVLYSQQYNVHEEAEFDSELSPNAELEVEIETVYYGSLTFAWAFRSERFSYGFGLTSGGEGMLNLQKSNSYIDDGAGGWREEDNESTTSDTLVNFSSSYKLDSKRSVGFKADLNSYYQNTESDIKDNGTTDTHSEAKIYRVSSGLTLGYYQSEENFSVGLVVDFGRYGYEWKNTFYRDNNSSYESSENVSPYYKQTGGPVCGIGFEFPFTRKLKLYANGGAGVPYSSNDKNIGNERTENRLRYLYSGLLGFSYRLSKNIDIEGSVVFYKYRVDGYRSNEKIQELNIESISNSFTIDYFFSENITLNFALRGSILAFSIENYVDKFQVDQKQYIAEAALGVSRKY